MQIIEGYRKCISDKLLCSASFPQRFIYLWIVDVNTTRRHFNRLLFINRAGSAMISSLIIPLYQYIMRIVLMVGVCALCVRVAATTLVSSDAAFIIIISHCCEMHPTRQRVPWIFVLAFPRFPSFVCDLYLNIISYRCYPLPVNYYVNVLYFYYCRLYHIILVNYFSMLI